MQEFQMTASKIVIWGDELLVLWSEKVYCNSDASAKHKLLGTTAVWHMSNVTRKPVFRGLRPGTTQTSLLGRGGISKALIRLHGWAGWSVPLLFPYGIYRLSHKVAHIVSWSTYIYVDRYTYRYMVHTDRQDMYWYIWSNMQYIDWHTVYPWTYTSHSRYCMSMTELCLHKYQFIFLPALFCTKNNKSKHKTKTWLMSSFLL